MSTQKSIKAINAFQGLSDDTQIKMAEIGSRVRLKKGETLFWEKDQVNAIYAVLSGKVALLRYSGSGQKRIFFILDQGSLVNEVVFDDLPVSVVCEAFEQTELLMFPKEPFMEIMKSDFELTRSIMCSMGKKQRRLYRQLKNTVPIKVDKKLAAKLWKLSKDYGVDDGDWKRIELKMNVTNLSYMMGSTRETISRSLKMLQEQDLVKWVDRKLYVREEGILKYYRED